MGKRLSKKRKDTSNCTIKSKGNGVTTSSSRKPTGSGRSSRSQGQGRDMADQRSNTLTDIHNLRVSESAERVGHHGVDTDRDREVVHVREERGVALTGNPATPEQNFHNSEVPSNGVPQFQFDNHQTSSDNVPISHTEVPQVTMAQVVTADTEHRAQRPVAVVHPTQIEQNNAHSNPHTSGESLSVAGQPHNLTHTSTQEQGTGDSEAITLTPSRSDTSYLSGTVSDRIITNVNLKQKIGLHLDKYHSVVKNWQHLASALKVPIDVTTRCKINAEYGRTQRLFEHIAAKQPGLTVKEFVSKLRKIGRNDVVLTVCNTVENAENSSERFCTVLNNNMQLADDIALKLDVESCVIKTWKDLAYQLGFSKKKVNLIKSGHSNPTVEIMEYVFTKHVELKLKKFKDIMVAIERNDVLELLKSYDETKKLVEVMPRDSELLEDVSIYLNGNAGGSLKDWKHFAYHLGIPQEIYSSYDPKKPHSPTTILLDWLTASNPDYTVTELCGALHSIDRNDVIELIKSTLEPGTH